MEVTFLHYAREQNATRYDATHKGQVYQILGNIKRIDNGIVTLSVENIYSGVYLYGTADLNDLPQEEQVVLNRGDAIIAVCEIGEYILGSIQANGRTALEILWPTN